MGPSPEEASESIREEGLRPLMSEAREELRSASHRGILDRMRRRGRKGVGLDARKNTVCGVLKGLKKSWNDTAHTMKGCRCSGYTMSYLFGI
jgi:hypothetical protein